jgi:Leucine Rich Repeat (LRR) protein
VPQVIIDGVKPSVTFTAEKIAWKGNISPEMKKAFEELGDKLPVPMPPELRVLLNGGVDGIYHLDPTKTPHHIDLVTVGPLRKTMLGIYQLDGDMLKVCISVNPDRVEERPTEFVTKPGPVLRGMVTLRRVPAQEADVSKKSATRTRREAIAELQRRGILVRQTQAELLATDAVEIKSGQLTSDGRIPPEILECLPHLAELLLDLSGTRISDAGLEGLAGVRNLERLIIGTTDKITDAGLVHLKDLPKLIEVNLWGNNNITDAGIEHLSHNRSLKVLMFSKVALTDKGAAHLKRLQNLWKLNLGDTELGDAGLADLKQLPRLQGLFFNSSKPTDAGLAHVKEMKNVGLYLGLRGSQITDEGLEHLVGLKELQSLDVRDTKVTPAAVQRLQKSLPECKVLAGNFTMP